jgi:hypothetical protein
MKVPNPWKAAKAAGRVAKAAAARQPLLVSQAVLDARQAACRACDCYIPGSDQCGVCSCVIALKSQLTTESCPHPLGGKWPVTSQSGG